MSSERKETNFKGYGPSGVSYAASTSEWTRRYMGLPMTVLVGRQTSLTVTVDSETIYDLIELAGTRRLSAGYINEGRTPAIQID